MLTSYNGQPVTYDDMGNITSLNGETYTWTAGRQLSRLTRNDNSYVDYFYDDNGRMSYFSIYEDDILVGTYNYLWDNTKLVGVQVTEYEADENNNLTETKTIINRIIYDADGEPLGYLLEDSVPYLYTKNILGDITGIVDGETGKLMLEYVYDAYGNMSIKTPGNSLGEVLAAILVLMYNPLTYRGYTFAPALGYNYYLGSRFYIPQLCRFMNADIYADTTQGVIGTNMFAYCNNNPISFVDPNGLAAYSQLSTVVNTIKLIAYMSIIIKYAKDNNIVFNEGIFRDYVSRITTKKSTYNSFVKQLYATILTLYGTHIYNLFDIASLYIDLFDLAGVKYTASMGKVIGVLPFAADIVKDFYSPFLSTDVVMNNLFNHILDFMGGSMITTLSTVIGTAVGSTLGQPILGFMVGFVVYLAATNLWQEFSNG